MGDNVVPITLPDGTAVRARVSRLVEPGDDDYGTQWEDVGLWDEVTTRVEGLRSLVDGVATSVREAASAARPDEWSVTFGVEISAKPGRAVALLADGEAKGNLSITLTWRDSGR
ncbi:CU044_2847 family protein [Streptomyces sp. Tu 3180]|uniref:CU044_2847 family protein n=1 Tax=Streptomyces sp. Tu 3180 TaxID=2682611 RepID=UPI0013575C10|nr:CU044_2847 family protein [Streptomyces sp. Tu 3180]KAF3469235.1 hypothetical protein GL259_36475 [Streptomyces sp. Tu 3180]